MPQREDDPLWLLIRPPANESPEQAGIRTKREAEAKMISDKIDEAIRAESASLKRKKIVRLLLLGQSKSRRLGPASLTRHTQANPNRESPQPSNSSNFFTPRTPFKVRGRHGSWSFSSIS